MSRDTRCTNPIGYQIHVRGQPDQSWSTCFAGFSIAHANGETVLTGSIADQGALYRILARVRDLGLTLVRVESVAQMLSHILTFTVMLAAVGQFVQAG